MGKGSEELFKKQRGQHKKRKLENRDRAPFKYLIVSEGEKTETNYFKGIEKEINIKFKNSIQLKEVLSLQIEGTGRNTNDLVKHVEKYIFSIDKIVNRSTDQYGHIWVIFDKDDFSDGQFNSAIEQAISKGYNVGWSNESFELWFLLHFEYLSTNIGREEYCKKLTQYFKKLEVAKKYNVKENKYHKNIPEIYDILTEYGNVDNAIANSKKLLISHTECGNDTYSKKAPANTVYLLVEELRNYL